MISILIPSRSRPESLSTAIDSLYWNADKPEDLQVLVRLDKEDPRLEAYCDPRAIYIIGPQLEGYKSMDIFWNELAYEAKGDWFFCFNDDAEITTPNWDRIINDHDPLSRTLLVPSDNATTYGWPAFPIFPRDVYDKLKHITLFPGLDTWLFYLWPLANREFKRVPINVNHKRPQMNDDTMHASAAASKELCIDFDITRKAYWRDLIAADARKLCE